jgi:hypothetical protein
MTVSKITVRSSMMLATILVLTADCSAGESKTQNSTTASTTVVSRVDDRQSGADTTAAGVIRRYYDAIQSHRYDSAYTVWADSGRASGQTPTSFAAGFAQTATVTLSIGDSVHVEAAAGSQYATVPVSVDATLRSGEHQHFVGSYTLRRSFVDGASPEQREWHIYSADLKRSGS